MSFECQIGGGPVPRTAESTTCDLPVPEIRKNLILPAEPKAQPGPGICNGIASFCKSAQKREVMRFGLRRWHLRQVDRRSILAFNMRPLALLFDQARGGWRLRAQDYDFTGLEIDATPLFEKRPAERRVMCPHELHRLIALVSQPFLDLKHRFTIFENHHAIK